MRCYHLSLQLYALALIFTGMLQGIHIPQSIIVILDCNNLCMDVEWQLIVFQIYNLSVSSFINELSTLVDCLNIVSQIQLFGCFITTVKDNRFRVNELIVDHGAHISQIHRKRGSIHCRQYLNEQPVKWIFYIHKAIKIPSSVKFNHNTVRFNQTIAFFQKFIAHCCFVIHCDQSSICLGKKIIIIFYQALLTGKQERALPCIESRIEQSFLNQCCFTAFQKSGKQIYRYRHDRLLFCRKKLFQFLFIQLGANDTESSGIGRLTLADFKFLRYQIKVQPFIMF